MKSNLTTSLKGVNKIKWNLVFKGILVGFITGLLVVLYRLGIEYAEKGALHGYSVLRDKPAYILLWLILIVIIGVIVYKLNKWEPNAMGSGIPQVKGMAVYGMKINYLRVIIVRYISGVLTSLFGVSMGREGPSIQIGACGSKIASEYICKNKLEDNCLATAGASAGLAAAFNAPLSGMIFALEEVHRSFSPLVLIAATTAALTSDMVAKVAFGLNTELNFIHVPQMPVKYYILLPIIGIASGVIGAITNKVLLGAGNIYKKFPLLFRPMIALLIALPFGLFLPQVLGGGNNLINISVAGKLTISLMIICLIGKLIFTSVCFGSGIPGGIFMPILSIGALTGCILGSISVGFGMDSKYISVFCVCAMAGALSGSVKAPITSILLIAEMTGSLVHLLPVATTTFIALFTSDIMKTLPIYDVLLERLNIEGNNGKKMKKGAIIEVAIEAGSFIEGKEIKDIIWPETSLIVGVRRGDEELIPNGSTRLVAGDYLIIVSDGKSLKNINEEFFSICHYNNLG
ncbi:MAG: ClC family H(+)/Cl(-) exchange transporter [Clostridium sp.]